MERAIVGDGSADKSWCTPCKSVLYASCKRRGNHPSFCEVRKNILDVSDRRPLELSMRMVLAFTNRAED